MRGEKGREPERKGRERERAKKAKKGDQKPRVHMAKMTVFYRNKKLEEGKLMKWKSSG